MNPIAHIPPPKLSIDTMLRMVIKVRDSLQEWYRGDRADEVDARNAARDLVDNLEDMQADFEARDEIDRSNFERSKQFNEDEHER